VTYLDAQVNPDVQPDASQLPVNVSGYQLLRWTDVPTAVRYVDTAGVFIEELMLQSDIERVKEAIQLLKFLPGQILSALHVFQ